MIGEPGAGRGPVVAWSTDPRARFRDAALLWRPDRPIPATTPPPATARTAGAPAQPIPAPAAHPRSR
ncbi:MULTISPECIES: hypothetical protein [unclassified Streptomyces]|uniref:hypothetical protein n=1 Tax=unclassified Streptomyces TaxID=2593676 RepID=UPI000D1A65CB|nr:MULTISPECIES: hypothetical protein [unclassified Streptomyces]RDV48414.1 hypothetical protein DDV98_30215 [Streptomyces sp. IB2014 011-12]